MALSGHPDTLNECLLLGVKRTLRGPAVMSVCDPKRTLSNLTWPLPACWLGTATMPGLRYGRTVMPKTKISAQDIVALSKKEGFLAKRSMWFSRHRRRASNRS
jgi:hypothetical protein